MDKTILPRRMTRLIAEHLENFPIVLVESPRQAGKTTLAKGFAEKNGFAYHSLDSEEARREIDISPQEFVGGLNRAVIDEIQLRPRLLRTLKMAVDERDDARFILTGSAAIKAHRQVTDLLAGRMCILSLLPLAQAELRETETNFLAYAFNSATARISSELTRDELQQAIIRGGYPRLHNKPARRQRAAWMRHYLAAVDLRDIPSFRAQKTRVKLKTLLHALALQSGGRLSVGKIKTKFKLTYQTCHNYIQLAEDLYLVRRLQVFNTKHGSYSLRRQPKLVFNDSGLLALLLGVAEDRAHAFNKYADRLLETFVYSEIAKQCNWLDDGYQLGCWTDANHEVDLVIEHGNRFVGIEAKYGTSADVQDFKGLIQMAKHCGSKRMARGIVICRCKNSLDFSARFKEQTSVPMQALPVEALWGEFARKRPNDAAFNG